VVGDYDTIDSLDSVSLNAWHHVTLVRSGGQVTFFIDGVQDSGGWRALTVAPMASATTAKIGARGDTTQNYFDGFMDEVRISSVSRSADWLAAEHANQLNPGTFFTVGTEETEPTAGLTFAITGGTGATAFAIDANTGEITVADSAQLDFETTPSFTLDVLVTDSRGYTDTATITVDLNDINDPPVLNDSVVMSLTTITEGDTNNQGDLVSDIIATGFGGNPITDVDAGAVEGITITLVDNANGIWEYSINDGTTWTAFNELTVSDTSAVLLTATSNDRVRFVPADNFNGNVTLAFRAWDTTDGNVLGATGVDVSPPSPTSAYSTATGTASITVQPVEVVLFMSSVGDVSLSGAPGLDSWGAGEALGFGDPNLAFEPGTTSGTLYSLFDLSAFEADGDSVNIDAIHQVSSNITVGGGAGSIELLQGDLLLAVKNQNNDFQGTDSGGSPTGPVLDVGKKDLFVFRPNTPGDYSTGTFFMLLDQVASNFLTGVSLVEQNTWVGDVEVKAGTFLMNEGNSLDIMLFDPTGAGGGVGVGALTQGTTSTLIAGADISGIDLIETDVTLGDATLTAGNILVTLTGNDTDVGNNDLVVSENDVFYLDVTKTGVGTTDANAYMFIEGGDIGFDTPSEEIGAR
jgi:hypothetical protein